MEIRIKTTYMQLPKHKIQQMGMHATTQFSFFAKFACLQTSV